MGEKVVVPSDVAKALSLVNNPIEAITTKLDFHGFFYYELEPLNHISADTLIRALYVGYEEYGVAELRELAVLVEEDYLENRDDLYESSYKKEDKLHYFEGKQHALKLIKQYKIEETSEKSDSFLWNEFIISRMIVERRANGDKLDMLWWTGYLEVLEKFKYSFEQAKE